MKLNLQAKAIEEKIEKIVQIQDKVKLFFYFELIL
jgi:hypothetical protein